LGLGIEREKLRARVIARTDKMFAEGLPEEAARLLERYTPDCSSLRTIGYQEFLPFLSGQATLDETKANIVRATMQYAKRQRTWFKRNKSVHYICCEEEAVDIITTFLNNLRTV
jgi:tRNA dimethylallyltransferase